MHKLFILCLLCFVPERISINVYVIKVNDDKQTNALSDQSKYLLEPMTDELRSEYKLKTAKSICDRHFGSIYGTKAQKLFCLQNYEERKLQNEPFKRKRKLIKQPKSFIDMTRGVASKPYSSDYVDFKDDRNRDEFSNDYLDVGDLVRYDYGTRRLAPYEIKLHKNIARFRAEDSDTSSEEDSDESQNRYQVIDNKASESESASSQSESGSKEDKAAKVIYFQGRNRYVPDNDGRRRLQHFLPKRFHWQRDDIKKLGYYWFNGPRGRFAEAVNLL